MKEVRQSLLIGICLSSLTTGQSASPANPLLDPDLYRLSIQREEAERELQVKQQQQLSERELHDRMNHVAEVWRGLVEEYNNKKSFNVRKARELSKVFRELEHIDCWPKLSHK